MCIIAYLPEGKRLTEDEIRAAFTRNDDGFGLMFPAPLTVNKLVVRKIVPAAVDDVITLYNAEINEEVLKKPHAVHFRFKTHGLNDKANAHPYRVLRKDKHGFDLYLMHNGVMNAKELDEAKQSDKSDTWHYITNVLRPTLAENPSLIYNTGFQKMMAMAIGSYNKLLLMDETGLPIIVNKAAGTLRSDGIWLSSPLPFVYASTQNSYYNNHHWNERRFKRGAAGASNQVNFIPKTADSMVPAFDPMNSVLLGTAGGNSGPNSDGVPDIKDGKYWNNSTFKLKEWQDDCTDFFIPYVEEVSRRAKEKLQKERLESSESSSISDQSNSPSSDSGVLLSPEKTLILNTSEGTKTVEVGIIEKSKQLSIFGALEKISKTGELLIDDEELDAISTDDLMQLDDDDLWAVVANFPDEVTDWISDTLQLLDQLSIESLRK